MFHQSYIHVSFTFEHEFVADLGQYLPEEAPLPPPVRGTATSKGSIVDEVLTHHDRLSAPQWNLLAVRRRRLRGKQAEAGVMCTKADPPQESAEDLFLPLGRDGDLLLASLEKETLLAQAEVVHLRSMRSGIRSFECTLCPSRAFPRDRGLDRHLLCYHTSATEYDASGTKQPRISRAAQDDSVSASVRE